MSGLEVAELPTELVLSIRRILDLAPDGSTTSSDPLDTLSSTDFDPVDVLNQYFPDGSYSGSPCYDAASRSALI
jgi:hypothetical protein